MEETKIDTENPSQTLIAFPPNRRKHLKSGTYRTLVRILSHCYDESQHSVAVQSLPQEPNQDNCSKEPVQATEKEVYENVEMVVPDNKKSENPAAQQVGVADESCDDSGFREKIEQIESLLSMEENEDWSKLKDVVDIENTLAIDFQDLLMNDLQVVVKENEYNTCRPSVTSLDENQSGSDKVALLTNQEVRDDFHHSVTVRSETAVQVVYGTLDSSLSTVGIGETSNQREYNEHGNSLLKTSTLDAEPIMQQKAMELETSVSSKGAEESFVPITEVGAIKAPENFSQKVPEAFDFSLSKDVVAQASKPTEYREDKLSSEETNYLEVEHEMQPKDKELEKIVCTRSEMHSPNNMNDGDVEEGEISGDDEMDDRSIDVPLHDSAVVEEKKMHKVQIVKDVIDKKERPCKEVNDKYFDYDSFLVDSVDKGKIGRTLELKKSSRTEMIRRPEVVEGKNVTTIQVDDFNPLLEGGEIEMKDNGVSIGIGCPVAGNHGTKSEEKADAGTCNKRKRGPLTKEKKEKKKAKERKKRAEKNRELGVKRLKLHPIQKTKTVAHCRHYVMGRCHEGDKCKFSHDTEPLTKSEPCRFFARQSCMKGDDCPYDHQLSKYPCNNFVASGFCVRGDHCMFSHKVPSKQDSATAASNPELKPPTGQGNSRSAQVNFGGASQKNGNALACSTGIHSRNNTKQNVTHTVFKQHELAVKGISFPSIGKSSLAHSSMSKQAGLAAERNSGAKAGNQKEQGPLSFVKSSNEILVRTPPATTPKGINFLSFGKSSPDDARGKNEVGHQTSPSVSEAAQNMNGILKVNQPAGSQGTNFNSFRKASVANSSSGKPDDSRSKTQDSHQTSPSVSETIQNLYRMLKVNQPEASQVTNLNPFGKASVANSSGEKPDDTRGKNQVGHQTSPSMSKTIQNLNQMLKVNQQAVSQGTNLNPFGKASEANTSGEKPVRLPSCGDNGSNRNPHESQNTADKPQNLSAISLRPRAAPLTSSQSSDCSASRFCKDTENSFQRGLFSTLAFAAKYNTQNMNRSIGSAGTQVDKETTE